MVFNLLLIFPFQHVGLAAATSMSAFLNAGLLLRGLLKEGVFVWQPGWGLYLVRLIVALLTLASVIYWLSPSVTQWLAADIWSRAVLMGRVVGAGVVAYFAVLVGLGMRLRDIRA